MNLNVILMGLACVVAIFVSIQIASFLLWVMFGDGK
jgi:hypothetical protein